MSQSYAGGIITANQNANFSGRFTGSNSYLSFPGAAQYAIATSTTPFTIEAWIKPTAAGGIIFSEDYGGVGNPINITCSLAASNDVSQPTGLFPAFGFYTTAPLWVTAAASTTPIVLNTWTHVAFVFTGSTSKIYINGVDVTKSSSPTPATTWGITANNGTAWYIGRRWDTGGSNVYWKGSINNFRFVNGSAVYTSNFAPPTNLTPITNTVMLTCQGPTFIDGSSYAATITNNNGVIVGTDNPFYTPSTPALGAATPGVWTLSQANQAAARRSWPMYDPSFNLVTGMVHGNGTNGGNNNTFLDSSTNNFSVTRNGNTTQGTFTPFSEPNGYWGNYFDGTGDYLTVPSSTNLEFGTGDFTIECWVYFISTSGTYVPFAQSDVIGASTNNKWFFALGSNTLRLQTHSTGGFTCTTPFNPAAGVWYHVSAVRSSGTILLFINGASGTVTTTGTPSGYNLGQNGVTVGGMSTPYYLNGYISNFRLIKGTALYTSSFTPSTVPLAPITNTQLLTCQNNRFLDNSTNAFAITPTGDTRTITYSPFYTPAAYYPQNNGGSMFFDGTGDTLQLTNSSPLTVPVSTSFTLECWVYLTAAQANYRMIIGDTDTYLSVNATGLEFQFGGNFSATISSCTFTFPVGAWVHIAVVRVTNTVSIYINGISQTVTNPTQSVKAFGWGSILYIGRWDQATPYNWFGYISNLRLVNGTAVYTSNFTPPTAPFTAASQANTQLLLSGTNASFIDNATNLTIETVNTTISTSQSKYGSGSMFFNGTDAYAKLITPFATSSTNYGPYVIQTTGDFTVEAWVNPVNTSAQRTMLYINGGTGSYASVRLDHTSTGAVQLLVSFNNSSWSINTTSTYLLTSGAWTHLAVVRAGPSIIVYANGSPIITSTVITMANVLYIGNVSVLGALLSTNYGQFFNGYISDFRTTNYARYLGVFTPPTSTLQNQ